MSNKEAWLRALSYRQATADAIRKLKIQQKGNSGPYVNPEERLAIQKALMAQVHQCHVSPVGRRQ